MENHRNRSTGNLSAFAVFSGLLGCLARLFTTQQEVNDPLIFWGFAGGALLNVVLALQMIAYWKSDDQLPTLSNAKAAAREPETLSWKKE